MAKSAPKPSSKGSRKHSKNDADAVLRAAVESIADHDPALAGARVTRWLLVAEHEWPGEGGRTLSVFRSPRQPPWDALGLLAFARVSEEARALDGPS